MSVEIEAYIDQVIKTLALKEDTNSLKVLIMIKTSCLYLWI